MRVIVPKMTTYINTLCILEPIIDKAISEPSFNKDV